MSIFSLSWFKRQSELENLVIEEQQLKNEILKKELGVDLDKKPYLNVKLVNDSLTIVLNDGSVLSKPNATKDDYYAAVNARTEGSLYSICADSTVMEEKRKQEAEIARIKAVQQGIKRLEGLADFEIEGNSVKLAGTGRTMPQLLVEKFIELVDLYDVDPYNDVTDDQEYQALKRFFMWCCLNPRAEVANDLYDFLNKNSFRITKQGFFVALRNVVTLRGSVELVQFVSNAYNKVKAVWKKSPDKYTVFLENCEYKLVHEDDLYETELVECQDCDGQGIDWSCENDEDSVCEFCDGVGQCDNMNQINHGEKIGNLTELYLDLPNRHENRFTDAHTRTFDIRVGQVVNMPPQECNWSTADCAHAGLHFTADEINYVGCGDQSVLILINPMKVVGIGEAKGRCYEYLPIMTVSREESTEILHDLDFDTLELDEAFAIHELENLAEKVKGGFVLEASKHQFNIPAMTHVQIENIVASLEEMKYSISNRVNIIK
jgi:hypothetical protein